MGRGGEFNPMKAPKTKLGFCVSLAIALLFMGATITFNVWRQDKPPGNPGGPVGNMGGWVVFWNWIAIGPGPMLSAWGWFNVILLVWEKFKGTDGGPWLHPRCLHIAGRFRRVIGAAKAFANQNDNRVVLIALSVLLSFGTLVLVWWLGTSAGGFLD